MLYTHFMTNLFEKGPQHSPTEEEVMEIIARHATQSNVIKEEADEQGVCFLELKAEGTKPGEFNEYYYMRKEGRKITIDVVYYENGEILTAEPLAVYNEEAGEWKEEI